eukprot:jgi/Picsp_1/5172/NSC_02535-R1_lumenal -like protein
METQVAGPRANRSIAIHPSVCRFKSNYFGKSAMRHHHRVLCGRDSDRTRGCLCGAMQVMGAGDNIQAAHTRREMLTQCVLVGCTYMMYVKAAGAFEFPPDGYRVHVDKLDGYSFFYPEDWIPVTTSGNDVFYRNPFNAEENLFVDISSPSSSKYARVEDLGSPEEAAKRTVEQYLEEFMSTRLGVKRTAEVESAEPRTSSDGKVYYDIQTRVKSYASRNQLAVTQGEIDDAIVQEFDRRYLTVLGAAGNRLYEFRLQTDEETFKKDPDRLLKIAQSFKCKEVDA